MGRVRYLIVLSFFLVSCAGVLRAQDSNFVRAQIRFLSSREMAGRSGCYDGEGRAARYLADQFRQMGALPLGDEGFQYYETPAHKMEGVVEFYANKLHLNPFTDYRIAPYAHSTHVLNAPVIRISHKILLDKEKSDAFIQKNAAKLKQSFLYIDQTCRSDEEKRDLQTVLRELTSNNPFQTLGILVGVDELPVWGLNFTDYERNYAFIYVRKAVFPSNVKTVSVNFTNEFFQKKTQNVCFYLPANEQPTDSMIVITAHYDHLGCMGDEVVFGGAHDNASGTAAVLDFARQFAQTPHKYKIVFLLFSGEESGLKGSRYFVENPLIPLEKVKFLMNLDMFCGGNEGFTVVNYDGDGVSPFYNALLELNEENHLVQKVNPRVNTANSDHYFFSKKCPAIFIYTMGGRYGGYHNYTDTCENCGLECYNNIFTLLWEALKTWWIPDIR